MFEKEFIKQRLVEFRPDFEKLIREVIAIDKQSEPLIVDYGEAGRLIGTTYEGVRKLVKKGDLMASRRSGRFVGIAMTEILRYVEENKLDRRDHSETGSNLDNEEIQPRSRHSHATAEAEPSTAKGLKADVKRHHSKREQGGMTRVT